MGTPNSGSHIVKKGDEIPAMLKRFIAVSGFNMNLQYRLHKDLKSHSRELLEINRWFKMLAGDIKIVTYVEGRVALGLDALVSFLSILPLIMRFLTFRIRLWTSSQLR